MSAPVQPPADEDFVPTTITASDLSLLREKELANVLAKIDGGITLTDREWSIDEGRVTKPSGPQNAARSQDTAPSVPSAVTIPTASPRNPVTIEEAAALYQTTPRTVHRWKEAGIKADAPCPWDRPSELPAWWNAHM